MLQFFYKVSRNVAHVFLSKKQLKRAFKFILSFANLSKRNIERKSEIQ